MSELDKYHVGIIYPCHAEDADHAIEQLIGALGFDLDSEEADTIRNFVNKVENVTKTTLEEALSARLEATDLFSEVAAQEIEDAAKKRYPTATHAVVTAILTDSYTEHEIAVMDAENNHLNEGDDWPWDEADPDGSHDWLINVTEGACGFEDVCTVIFSDDQ